MTTKTKKRYAVKILLHGGYNDHVRIHYYNAISAKDAARKAQRSLEWGPYRAVHHPELCNDPAWYYEVKEMGPAPCWPETFELSDLGLVSFAI